MNRNYSMDWLDEDIAGGIGFAEADILFPKGMDIYPASKMSPTYKCLINPQSVEGWFSAAEINEYRKWDGVKIILGEWFFAVPDTDDKPFQPFIERFFLMKENNPKGSPEAGVAKT